MRTTQLTLALMSAASLAAITPSTSYAQTLPGGGALPGSAQPGRIQQQLEPVAPAPGVQLIVSDTAPMSPIPAGAEKITLNLASVSVNEMTVYSPADIEPLYKDMIGKEITLADVYKLAEKLTDKYRNDGYIMSRVVVPTQNIKSGNVTLLALEGFINKVYFETDPGLEALAESKTLRGMVERLEGLKPLNSATLERKLLLMNDLPGMQVKAVVKASPGTPRAADLHVLVSRQRVTGYVATDNRGSRFLGPVQFQGGITLNQVFDERDQVSFRALTSYQISELKYGQIDYQRLLTNNGLTMRLTGNMARTKPGASLKPFDVRGQDAELQARLSYPLLRARSQNLDVYGLVSYHNVRTDALGTNLSQDHIRVARAGSTWSKADRLMGTTRANVEMSQGLEILDASKRTDPTSRTGTKPNFTKFNAGISREQFIRNSGFSLFGSVVGQYATSPLYASEQMGLGGESIGSAYDPSEITGDSGIAGRLEARYSYAPNIRYVKSLQPYAFYDLGQVYNRVALPGVSQRPALSDAGVGVRAALASDVNASLEVAQPLTRDVSALGNADYPRVFFKLSKAF